MNYCIIVNYLKFNNWCFIYNYLIRFNILDQQWKISNKVYNTKNCIVCHFNIFIWLHSSNLHSKTPIIILKRSILIYAATELKCKIAMTEFQVVLKQFISIYWKPFIENFTIYRKCMKWFIFYCFIQEDRRCLLFYVDWLWLSPAAS